MMKKGKKSEDLFKEIGRKNGMPAEKVRKEIERAIMEAYNSSDPKEQAEFKKRFGNRIPTPEEFVCSLTKAIKSDE